MHVTYVFGSRLPKNGRCPTNPTELARLCRRADEVVVYVVEVCPKCSWNHLARMYPAGGRHRAARRAPVGATADRIQGDTVLVRRAHFAVP